MTKPSPLNFPDRIEKVAADIYNDVIKDHENEPISALCVLKGGYKFFTDVLNKMTQLNSIGDKSVQISTEFIRLKSYVDERYENLPGISLLSSHTHNGRMNDSTLDNLQFGIL